MRKSTILTLLNVLKKGVDRKNSQSNNIPQKAPEDRAARSGEKSRLTTLHDNNAAENGGPRLQN